MQNNNTLQHLEGCSPTPLALMILTPFQFSRAATTWLCEMQVAIAVMLSNHTTKNMYIIVYLMSPGIIPCLHAFLSVTSKFMSKF